jgi:diamine N-acetyltransferase
MTQTSKHPSIHFERITSKNVLEVCALSETLSLDQQQAVADNALSIAQGLCSENAWLRAVYADDQLVGFIMLHIGSDWADGIDCPGVFLWRFMIGGPFQGKGYGREAMLFLIRQLRSLGIPELHTSYHLGEASPEGFYKGLGFVPTGDHYGDEPEVVLKI